MNPKDQPAPTPRHKAATASITDSASAPGETFFRYLFKNKTNKRLLLGWLGINLLLFLGYKYFFPMPDFFSDSNSYVLAAAAKAPLYYRPMGYSNFLNMVHDFSDSCNTVVALQYALLCLASLFCFFSMDYLFGFTNKKIKYIALVLLAVNPFLLPLSNQVASDSLFAVLTAAWFGLLLWVIKRHTWWALVLQLLLLYWVFEVRYNALYYPLIGALAFLFTTKVSLPYRIIGIAASVLVTFGSYRSIKKLTYETTNADVFSGFSGWQMANNALFMYKHIDVKKEDFDDNELQLVDTFVKVFIDSLQPAERAVLAQGKLTNSIFMWDTKSPLKKYLAYYCMRNQVPYFEAWYQVSETYNAYGKALIMQHPGAYFKYFLWNNTKFFFAPEAETLEKYLLLETKLPESTMKYYNLKSDTGQSRAPGLQSAIVAIYPFLHAILVLVSLVLPVVLFLRYRAMKNSGASEDIFRLVVFWYLFFLANMGFCILSAIVVLRCEATWFILCYAMLPWFADRLISLSHTRGSEAR